MRGQKSDPDLGEVTATNIILHPGPVATLVMAEPMADACSITSQAWPPRICTGSSSLQDGGEVTAPAAHVVLHG